jgi:hypothetical protein
MSYIRQNPRQVIDWHKLGNIMLLLNKYFISFLLLSSVQSFCYCENWKNEEPVYYSGIRGCNCFQHCECRGYFLCMCPNPGHFCHDPYGGRYDYSGAFPNVGCRHHPLNLSDHIWHEFMINFLDAVRVGPFSTNRRDWVPKLTSGISLLGQYLNAINNLKLKIISLKETNIAIALESYKYCCQKWGYRKAYEEEFSEKIDKENRQADNALDILNNLPGKIIPMYSQLTQNCPHDNANNLSLTYNRGLLAFLKGRNGEFLSSVDFLIEYSQKNFDQRLLSSDIFQKQGEAFHEVGLYHEAVRALSNAISQNPENHEAYFHRATAYFELGKFDKSLEDFLQSKSLDLCVSSAHVSDEFILAFTASAAVGAQEAFCDFVPSMCNTAYGMVAVYGHLEHNLLNRLNLLHKVVAKSVTTLLNF